MEHKIISGDGHIDLRWLPHDLFVSNAPAPWKDQVPRVVDTKEGKHWFAEGNDLTTRPFGLLANTVPPPRGQSKHVDRMYEAGFYDGKPHPTTPELRLRDQDLDGIAAEVIYGILGISRLLDDRELLRVVYEIYNTWLADFCRTNPERLVGLACLPNDDPELAAAELRRSAKLGLKGVDFAVSTAVKPIWHRDWDPLWAAAAECHMPISFHTTGYAVRGPSDEQMAKAYESQVRATRLTMFQLAGAEFLASIIFSGALERYPGMRFVLGECGASWLPYVLARMDEEYEDQFQHLNFSLKPSEYWRRQGSTTFQHETTIADIVHLVGEDNVVWGSDYPHPDGIWPDSLKMIEADLGRLDTRVRRKITCENTGKLYGLR
ncbi:MAG: amidohydrolase [Nitrospinae bacterium]|nr:amidohydrolase [Nitrospinota bacterium]